MSNPTGSRASRKPLGKPKKPYPAFPLTPHPSGKWCKKIRGTMHYFGSWAHRVEGVLVRVEGDGAKEAEAAYNAVVADLHAGRTPRASADGLTVADLCNRFLTAKLRKVEAREMGQRSFRDYREVTDILVSAFGANRLVDDLAADDFARLRAAMAKRWGPVWLGNGITRVKSVFKYGPDNGIVERPVRYGSEFAPPDKAVLRKHRAKRPPKMFEADELRAMIDGKEVKREGEDAPTLVKPDPTLRAMILLGINCGFGTGDCAGMVFTGLDLDGGWIDYPRPKTGIAPLPPLAGDRRGAAGGDRGTTGAEGHRRARPGVPDGPRQRVHCVARQVAQGPGDDPVHAAAAGPRHAPEGVSFCALRHVFETVAGGSKDQVAVDLVMGHADRSMAAHDRERIDDARLRAVADHVRAWLWPKSENRVTEQTEKPGR